MRQCSGDVTPVEPKVITKVETKWDTVNIVKEVYVPKWRTRIVKEIDSILIRFWSNIICCVFPKCIPKYNERAATLIECLNRSVLLECIFIKDSCSIIFSLTFRT